MASGAQLEKRLIRPRVQAAIDALSEGDRAARSAAVCRGVIESDQFHGARAVLAYLPMAMEVDVTPLIAGALNAGKRVGLPRMDWSSRTMWGVEVFDAAFATEIRRHGVREPLDGPPLSVGELDLIIAPGIAFDLSGGRLGRGAGYYDRFLALWRRAREGTPALPGADGSALGVCFALQLVDRVPRETHDALMDGVVSERGLTMCRDGADQADRNS